MQKLPHTDHLFLDVRKLSAYCLDPTHPRGRHKARVFRDALGIGPKEAAWLRAQILDGVEISDAVELAADEFGRRWRADLPVQRNDKRATIRTVWISRAGEDEIRFVTCWVL
jgi:hypothetical protein